MLVSIEQQPRPLAVLTEPGQTNGEQQSGRESLCLEVTPPVSQADLRLDMYMILNS